jgi:hypothetical protein
LGLFIGVFLMSISLAEAKQHLRLQEDSGEEDAYIEMLIKTALRGVKDYIDRPFTDPVCQDEDNATLLAAPLRYAALLILGDLYENREAQQSMTLNINMTCQNLMNPYRKWGV